MVLTHVLTYMADVLFEKEHKQDRQIQPFTFGHKAHRLCFVTYAYVNGCCLHGLSRSNGS